MMIDPPVDKLVKKADCNYALTCAVAKRTRELVTSDINYLQQHSDKPITRACKDIMEGKIKIVKE